VIGGSVNEVEHNFGVDLGRDLTALDGPIDHDAMLRPDGSNEVLAPDLAPTPRPAGLRRSSPARCDRSRFP
jgi:hypothetical protein